MPRPPGFDPQDGITFVYEHLAAHIEGRIRSGEFQPGARLPGEIALKEEYIVSLSSVRSAMRLLREQGLIQTRPVKGSFVVSELPPPET